MKKKYFGEYVVKTILVLFTSVSIIITTGIVFSLVTESLPFFNMDRVKQLLSYGEVWSPRDGLYHIFPLIVGTLMIVIFSCLFAIPLGLGSAIYLSEYSNPKVRNFLKPILEILAGVPSVVYGFFALFYITPFLKKNISWITRIALILAIFLLFYLGIKFIINFLRKELVSQKIINAIFGGLFFITLFYLLWNFKRFFVAAEGLHVETFNVLSTSFAVGIMITPLVASISEDALKSVPKSMREGSLALGATRFETIWNVTVPAAISGIISSFILAVSRAIGETMIVTMAAGAKPVLNFNPLSQVQTMTGYMVNKSFGEVVVGGIEYQTIFVVGLILFFITLFLNIIAKKVVNKYREVY